MSPYLQFKNRAGDVSFLAHPVKFLPGVYQQSVIQPGSRDPLGNVGIWGNDMDAKGTTPWVDNETTGLFCRQLDTLKDALGSVGTIDGVRYRFDDLLQIGQNVAVYQLTNLDTCSYLAYGFPIDNFDVRQALIRYLRRVGEQKEPFVADRIITLADHVLQAFPADETAMFNKGVVRFMQKQYAEANQLFSSILSRDGSDPLIVLHGAATLAGMGEHQNAVRELRKASELSEEGVRQSMASFSSLKQALSVSVNELPVRGQDQSVADLWVKYFQPAA